MYVKNNLQSLELYTTCKSSVWCSLKLKGRDVLLIGVLYRSPGSSVSENNMFIEQFSTVMKEKHSHLLIIGDFNFPEIDWSLQISNASRNHPSHDFISCYKDSFLYQHVTQPTHYRAQQNANILDVIMTNQNDMVDSLQYREPIGKSHHVVLDWTFNCYGLKSQSKSTKYFYDRGYSEAMRNCFKTYNWTYILSDKSVDEMWESIHNLVHATVDKFVPHRSIKAGHCARRKPVWMNERVMCKLKTKGKSFQRYKETRDGKDYLEFVKSRNAAKIDSKSG